MRLLCLAVLLLAFLLPAHAETAADPAAVVQKTFQVALKHFGFTTEAIKVQKSRLTPHLYDLLWKKVNKPVPQGDIPDIDGDAILDCQDPPQSFHLGVTTFNGMAAGVPVTLVWSGEIRHYVVQLLEIDGAWKINDIDFGKDGTLLNELK